MPYDEELADRVRAALAEQPSLDERRMFGGVGFLVQGNMCCGVLKDEMIVRIGPDQHDQAMARQHVREFDFTGRPLKGWVMVAPEGCESDEALQDWVRQGLQFALSLPPK